MGKAEYAPDSLMDALASFFRFIEFERNRVDGEYEKALCSFRDGMVSLLIAGQELDAEVTTLELNPFGFRTVPRPPPVFDVQKPWGAQAIDEIAPWVTNFDFQEVLRCFEAVRDSGRIANIKELVEVCDDFASPDFLEMVPSHARNDVQGSYPFWDWTTYWANALGWVQARLTKSELLEVLQQREDEQAERRLTTYFFRDGLWSCIPEKTRRSLVNAEREWYSGGRGRQISALNELRVATVSLLYDGLWSRLLLADRKRVNGVTDSDLDDFKKAQQRLSEKHANFPDLSEFEIVCASLTDGLLKACGCPDQGYGFMREELPQHLKRLRTARNPAEHDPRKVSITREHWEIYAEFVGVGKPGVLPKLVAVLGFDGKS